MNNNKKKTFLMNVYNKLEDNNNQFKSINPELHKGSSIIKNVNSKLSKYNEEVGKSSIEVRNLRNKVMKERRIFYGALIFYCICLGIIVFRRIPLIVVVNFFFYIIELIKDLF